MNNLALKSLVLASAAILAGISSASAGQITQTGTEMNTGTFSDTYSFSGFNTALGTLTGITLSLGLDETASERLINIASTPQAYTNATASFDISATSSAPGSTATVTSLLVSAGPFAGLAAALGTTNNLGSPDSASSMVNVLPAEWSFYEVPSITVTADLGSDNGTYGGSQTDGDGTLFFGGNLAGSSTVTLVYDYTARAVPEPITLSLFGAGLAGAAAMRRRKANKA